MKMKFALACAALMLSGTATAQERNRVVELENHTGQTITYLYGSRTSTNEWENDLLGDGVMADSTHRRIDMFDGTNACMFDFKAILSDGRVRYRSNVDVCAVDTVTFGTLMHGATN